MRCREPSLKFGMGMGLDASQDHAATADVWFAPGDNSSSFTMLQEMGGNWRLHYQGVQHPLSPGSPRTGNWPKHG